MRVAARACRRSRAIAVGSAQSPSRPTQHGWRQGSLDNTVKIWDASSGACLSTLEGHSSWVSSVAFSPDSTRLASGSLDNTVYQGLGMSSDRMWITYNSENILWLPSEYRPSRFIVSKNMIGPFELFLFTIFMDLPQRSFEHALDRVGGETATSRKFYTPCGFATSASSN
ncbi:hypothetical protein GQ44DRAFT_389682 [Phaeosphaeriaceae sp. PMI808]|nr:hypothetical protein GQ44DRAFT_389682 [Phaeosphaeriaceae sp. PMI808]